MSVAIATVIFAIQLGTAFWVWRDADRVGLDAGRWTLGCLLLWSVFFPWYLIRRSRAQIVDSPHAPAGWYADPKDRDRMRWWDGQRWTGHLHDSGP